MKMTLGIRINLLLMVTTITSAVAGPITSGGGNQVGNGEAALVHCASVDQETGLSVTIVRFGISRDYVITIRDITANGGGGRQQWSYRATGPLIGIAPSAVHLRFEAGTLDASDWLPGRCGGPPSGCGGDPSFFEAQGVLAFRGSTYVLGCIQPLEIRR
ncbi:MAG: hypothetical protein NTV34_05980 [Proteobacteria bacterium]|nr:hypothetical protein [Pseudomonadota bacterium]